MARLISASNRSQPENFTSESYVKGVHEGIGPILEMFGGYGVSKISEQRSPTGSPEFHQKYEIPGKGAVYLRTSFNMINPLGIGIKDGKEVKTDTYYRVDLAIEFLGKNKLWKPKSKVVRIIKEYLTDLNMEIVGDEIITKNGKEIVQECGISSVMAQI